MVALVGNYTGAHNNPVFQTNKEIWAFGSRGQTLPRIDVLFQLHLPYAWEEVPVHEEWLRNNKSIPVYMRERYDGIPMSVRYPVEEVLGLTDGVSLHGEALEYLTSSPAYAIALAILLKKERIEIYEIELRDREYEHERDGIAFWIGLAAGKGIPVDVHCMSNVFDKPLYGAQREP